MALANGHWTQRSIDDFVYKISSDFVFQLVKKMDSERVNQKAIAEKLGVSVGRVSQVLNNPGNLTLKKCVQYARILDMKTALVAYEDGDPNNEKGPINSEIFYRCWQYAGGPRDFFELAENTSIRSIPNLALGKYVLLLMVEQHGSMAQQESTGSRFFFGEPIPDPSRGAITTSGLTYRTQDKGDQNG